MQHFDYEIFEGMARIYGTLDVTAVQHVKNCLEQNGLNPVLFSRNSPFGNSGPSHSLFDPTGDYSRSIEIKVMVPCQEVLGAEEVLRSINTKN
jgi:hypothetical protein